MKNHIRNSDCNQQSVRISYSILIKRTLACSRLSDGTNGKITKSARDVFAFAISILLRSHSLGTWNRLLCRCLRATCRNVGLIADTLCVFLKDEEHCTLFEEEPRTYRHLLRPLYIRLMTIFVYTEVVVRTIDSTTTYNVHDLANRAASVDVLPMLTGIRVWRILQLVTVTLTYLYQLFKQPS